MYCLYSSWEEDSLSVRVGREHMKRALGIFDDLIRRVERAGGKVVISRERPPKTFIQLDGVKLQVMMYELTTRADHVPTTAEREQTRKGHGWGVPKWDFTPSGELVFKIEDFLGTNVQRTWTDGRRRKLSENPDRFFERFRKAIEARKVQEAKWEEQQRDYRRRELQAEEELQRREKERRRLENVKLLAENWETAMLIRDFVAAAREGLRHHHGTLEEGSPLIKWLEDAETIADRLDPIPEAFCNLSPRREEETGPSQSFPPTESAS